ncbi:MULTISPECIES: hypothetical protein [unclassified Haloferax]|uniref:hypothetical protein n=1 Tax=unclassified Haloferax TaxID=2625095 RepID=UPI000E2775B5|nr:MULTISPECIES: hypothetical protein [unclassified Haloferax]RDZ35529.1 hypothetical protein C5B88_14205 [Haloferax sp. Atlit-24N]RLM35941.1 hypothetical protein DVK03_14215 [Haloferax sp. Atlit-109R]RLM43791.1 hypothetical protein DVK04_14215 [Haloferax sp. Atlit-105R]
MVFKIEPEPPDDSDDGEDKESRPDGFYRGSFDDTNDFLKYLDEFYGYYPGSHLQIIPGVTSHSKEEFINELMRSGQGWYEEHEYGAVSRLISDEENETGIYFVKRDSDGLFTIVTNDSKSDYVDGDLIPDLKRVYNTQVMQVSSRQIRQLVKDMVSANDQAKATEFHLRRRRGESNPSIPDEFDTDNKRTLSYWGDDGATALPHLLDTFGVRISKICLEIPDVIRFRIDESGVLKLESGSIIDLLYERVDGLTDKMVNGKKAYDSADVDTIKLGDMEVSQASPALITPSDGSEFDYETIEGTIESLRQRNYAPVDPIVETDPVYFTTTIYDVSNGLYFDLRGDSQSMRLFPRDGSEDLRTFFGVLESVQENVEKDAQSQENVEVVQE